MSVRPLRIIGDPVLRTPCDQVTRFETPWRGSSATCSTPSGAGPGWPRREPDRIEPRGLHLQPGRRVRLRDQPGARRDRRPAARLRGLLVHSGRQRRPAPGGLRGGDRVDLDQRPVIVAGRANWPGACSTRPTISGELYIDKLTGPERDAVFRALRAEQAAKPRTRATPAGRSRESSSGGARRWCGGRQSWSSFPPQASIAR